MICVKTAFTNVVVCTLCTHCDRHAPVHTHIQLHHIHIAQATEAREKKAGSRRGQGAHDPSVDEAVDAINAAAAIPAGGGADTDAALDEIFDDSSRPANTQAAVAAVSTQVLMCCATSTVCHPCMCNLWHLMYDARCIPFTYRVLHC